MQKTEINATKKMKVDLRFIPVLYAFCATYENGWWSRFIILQGSVITANCASRYNKCWMLRT